MKKLTRKKRDWLIRKAILAERKRIRTKYIRFISSRLTSQRHSTGLREGVSELSAPPVMSLRDNFDEVALFIKKFRAVAVGTKNHVAVDFTTIQQLSPGAALVLVAELDRWRKINGIKLKPYNIYHWSPEVKRLLSEMGFFELLDQDPRFSNDCLNSGKRFIKFVSGQDSTGELVGVLQDEISACDPNLPRDLVMYDALSEAVTNSVQHAYPPTEVDCHWLPRQWWLSGELNRKSGTITILCYDQGVGIQNTLPKKFTDYWSAFANLYNDSSHVRMIEAALSLGRTRTMLAHRGKGLQQVLQLAEKYNGNLRIISGNGEYFRASDGTVRLLTHGYELGGTFIQWELNYFDGGCDGSCQGH